MASVLDSRERTVTTSGTAVQLMTSPTYAVGLTIRARAGNTGVIYIGDSSVGSSYGRLSAGDMIEVVRDAEFNLENIYLDASVNGESVDFFWMRKAE